MNEKSLYAIELYQLYESRNISNITERLFNISDILIYLHEILAEKNISLSEKDIYSEQLVIKFYLQNLSLIKLSDGHSLLSSYFPNTRTDIKFLDISSIITILRSQYESMLMYQHLYINSDNENQQQLRFDSWILASMILRSSKFTESQQKVPERFLKEQESIDDLRERIKNNPEFHKLSQKEQIQVIAKGSGKLFKHWDTIFDESKFTKDGVFGNIYYLASIYAHSEGLSALQLKQTKHLKDDKHLKETTYLMLFYSYLMTNVMIKNIVNKFPDIKDRFDLLDDKIKFEIDFNNQLSFK